MAVGIQKVAEQLDVEGIVLDNQDPCHAKPPNPSFKRQIGDVDARYK
jgi:hypothetical protein